MVNVDKSGAFIKRIIKFIICIAMIIMPSYISFNSYAASVSANLPIELKLAGDSYSGSQSFSFTIEAFDASSPMPASAVLELKKGSVSFGPIIYDTLGNYSYRITQTSSDVKNFTIDRTAYDVTVSVYTDAGALKCSIWAAKESSPGTKAEEILFTNTYDKPGGGGSGGSSGGGSGGGNKGYTPDPYGPGVNTGGNDTDESGGNSSGGLDGTEEITDDKVTLRKADGDGSIISSGSGSNDDGFTENSLTSITSTYGDSHSNPKTGDMMHMTLLFGIMLVSGGMLIILVLKKKREQDTQ